LIRKLILGGSAFAVAAMALLLVTMGGSQAEPAEAHVQGIVGPAFVSTSGFAEIRVLAQDGHGDVYIAASAGTFIFCEDDDNNFCDLDALSSFPFQSGIVDDSGSDTDELELIWIAPPGFAGGAVTFVACQEDEAQDWFGDYPNITCDNGKFFQLQVVGAPASIELHAQRGYSNEPSSSECADTPVYIIAAFESYTFNNFTTFDNDRAIICAEVRDSVGHPLAGENVVWSTTDGCLDDLISNTETNGIVHNRLVSCNQGLSGDVATVRAFAGTASDTVTVAFGGDPASCTITVGTDPLDLGDSSEITALFLDAEGNPVPDGIIAHLEEVDSGDGADNIDFVSVSEDTVQGMIQGNIIGAISGLVTVAASIEAVGSVGDATCTEVLEITGDIHEHEFDCENPEANDDGILHGFQPPPGGGFGTFAFCGGSFAQLYAASGCPSPRATSTAAFFYNTPAGGWAVWIPGSQVAAVNAAIFAIFPQEHQAIPEGTIFTVKCV
jgi:hypothetical protein